MINSFTSLLTVLLKRRPLIWRLGQAFFSSDPEDLRPSVNRNNVLLDSFPNQPTKAVLIIVKGLHSVGFGIFGIWF